MESKERVQFDSEVYFKLKAAEKEAKINGTRYSSEDVLNAVNAVCQKFAVLSRGSQDNSL